MDITGTSPARFEFGIRLFLEGKAISYNEVAFYNERNKVLTVSCGSDWNAENTTPDMARQKIERSKAVLEELSGKSNEFSEVANRLPHTYYFVLNVGNAGIVLAQELNGEFTWYRTEEIVQPLTLSRRYISLCMLIPFMSVGGGVGIALGLTACGLIIGGLDFVITKWTIPGQPATASEAVCGLIGAIAGSILSYLIWKWLMLASGYLSHAQLKQLYDRK